MANEDETDLITSTFRCVDPIDNLQIRIVIKPAKTAFIPLQHFELDKTSSPQLSSATDGKSDKEEHLLKWQEKIFSRREIKLYSNIANCTTKLHEKYHEQVSELLKNKKHNGMLYTYADVDNYQPSDQEVNLVDGSCSYISRIAKQMKRLDISGGGLLDFRNIPKRNVVKEAPSTEFRNRSHFITRNLQHMYIMADLDVSMSDEEKKRPTETSREYILCAIQFDAINKVLEIFPSFSENETSKPYPLGRHLGDTRCSYHYWIIHTSKEISTEEDDQEKRIMDKISKHQLELRGLGTSVDNFAEVPTNKTSVVVFGEIISCRNFEYNFLFVHYFVILPPGWSCSDPSQLTGVTQAAKSSSDGVCHYSHLFQFTLWLDITPPVADSIWPEVYLEVLSLDKWSRYRNEGYCWTPLPPKPGSHHINLSCWRALSKSRRSKMERFFIGGGPELESIAYIGSFAQQKNGVISRFGFETSPSGVVDLRFNILHQSQPGKRNSEPHYAHSQRELERSLIEGTNVSSLLGSVNAVLEAFLRARERMLKAKQGIYFQDKSD